MNPIIRTRISIDNVKLVKLLKEELNTCKVSINFKKYKLDSIEHYDNDVCAVRFTRIGETIKYKYMVIYIWLSPSLSMNDDGNITASIMINLKSVISEAGNILFGT